MSVPGDPRKPHRVNLRVAELSMIEAYCSCGYVSTPTDRLRASLAGSAHTYAMELLRRGEPTPSGRTPKARKVRG